ncbi:protein serine/threonine phosphatase 2C [Trametes elegans]|nr:protein serine/threonine phosphatase 2C [Trametes elegans]
MHSSPRCGHEPNEDEHSVAILPVPSGYWFFFGIFDGFSGLETSVWLSNNLIPAVTGALGNLYTEVASLTQSSDPQPLAADVVQTISKAFKRLDDDLVYAPLDAVLSSDSLRFAVSSLAPAYSGSCALLSYYDSRSRQLYTALTGNSRAVLGRATHNEAGIPTGAYSIHELSVDQTDDNRFERARLEAEHPGEPVVWGGRVLGLGLTRAFGEARYKWPLEVQRRLKQHYLGRTPVRDVKTPPYLTAWPALTSIEVQPGDFLIMGSDGLWECLTNEEAVGLVGLWKEMRSTRSSGAEGDSDLSLSEIPVEREDGYRDKTVRYQQWGVEKRFVGVDENVATHLLRNALGGANSDLTAALLSMRASRSRAYRDDITVIVVFFGEEDRRTTG